MPRYEFYYAPMEKNNLVIMTGEIQPSFDDVVAHYTVCDSVLDFVETLGCKFIVTMGGVPITEDKTQVYIAATSSRLATEFMEKGAVIYSKGRIVGGTGLDAWRWRRKEKSTASVCWVQRWVLRLIEALDSWFSSF